MDGVGGAAAANNPLLIGDDLDKMEMLGEALDRRVEGIRDLMATQRMVLDYRGNEHFPPAINRNAVTEGLVALEQLMQKIEQTIVGNAKALGLACIAGKDPLDHLMNLYLLDHNKYSFAVQFLINEQDTRPFANPGFVATLRKVTFDLQSFPFANPKIPESISLCHHLYHVTIDNCDIKSLGAIVQLNLSELILKNCPQLGALTVDDDEAPPMFHTVKMLQVTDCKSGFILSGNNMENLEEALVAGKKIIFPHLYAWSSRCIIWIRSDSISPDMQNYLIQREAADTNTSGPTVKICTNEDK